MRNEVCIKDRVDRYDQVEFHHLHVVLQNAPSIPSDRSVSRCHEMDRSYGQNLSRYMMSIRIGDPIMKQNVEKTSTKRVQHVGAFLKDTFSKKPRWNEIKAALMNLFFASDGSSNRQVVRDVRRQASSRNERRKARSPDGRHRTSSTRDRDKHLIENANSDHEDGIQRCSIGRG